MLSFPHLVVLFVIALVIFGPQKLPELARMLGKATAEFRKMTNDFRYALEDEVRELDRQTRIREEEAAAATRAAQQPQTPPEGVVQRIASAPEPPVPAIAELPLHEAPASPQEAAPQTAVTSPNEKAPDDNTAV